MVISLREYSIDDISDMNSLTSGRCGDYTQIGRGHFQGVIRQVTIGTASILTGRINREFVGCVRSAHSAIFIDMPLSHTPSARFNGRPVAAGDLIVHWGQEGKTVYGADNFAYGVIELPADTALKHMPFGNQEVNSSGSGVLSVRNPELQLGLRCYLSAADALAEGRDRILCPDRFAPAFISYCWHLVERCFWKETKSAGMLALPQRLRLFKQARELIHQDDETPLNVSQVAQALGVHERTLNQCFRSAIGQSPRSFLRAVRLNKARTYILTHAGKEDGVVTAAAMRFGFWHLGRFSAYYRSLFGEYPSETAADKARRRDESDHGTAARRGGRGGPPGCKCETPDLYATTLSSATRWAAT